MVDTDKHIYEKGELINLFEGIKNKTLGEIDNLGIFENVQEFNTQKGVAGTIIEQCVLGYKPDNKQRPDLIVKDGKKEIPTEVKTTGIKIAKRGKKKFVAKEPMSITAVGIYDIANQKFSNSHFWSKAENMFIIFYHYLADKSVKAYEYASFPIKDYTFHKFTEDEIKGLEVDWNIVHDFCSEIVSNHPGEHTKEWKKEVKQEYIDRHSSIRKKLSYIELVPKFPPRFRLKKAMVDTIVANHFNHNLEKLEDKYITVSEIDKKCNELSREYGGLTIEEIASKLGVPILNSNGTENKNIAEQILVRMFGGKSKKLNEIEIFNKFGLIAKSITITQNGGRTEDMKLYQIDFNEMTKTDYTDEDGNKREFEFEDSELYEYFSSNEFLCIIFQEPKKEYYKNPKTNRKKEKKHPLVMNKFVGFQRLVFSEEFINTVVRRCWEDTREKIFENSLEDVVQTYKDGRKRYNSNGEVSTAPNFIKVSQNTVFIRGGGENSYQKNKKECVNGIKMIPQHIWISGKAIVEELDFK